MNIEDISILVLVFKTIFQEILQMGNLKKQGAER